MTEKAGRMPDAAMIWRTREGVEIPVRELETRHLVNILRYGVRQHTEREEIVECAFSALAYSGSAPDGASMAAERAANDGFRIAGRMADPTRLAVWPHIVAECKRRGLWHELEEVGIR